MHSGEQRRADEQLGTHVHDCLHCTLKQTREERETARLRPHWRAHAGSAHSGPSIQGFSPPRLPQVSLTKMKHYFRDMQTPESACKAMHDGLRGLWNTMKMGARAWARQRPQAKVSGQCGETRVAQTG